MAFLKELFKHIEYYDAEGTEDFEKSELLRFRLYYWLGAIFTPLITLFTQHNQNELNNYFLTFITLLFVGQIVFSFNKKFSDYYNQIRGPLLFGTFLFVTLYTASDAYFKGFNAESTFAHISLIIVLSIALVTKRQLLIFFGFNSLITVSYILLANSTAISKEYLTIFFVFVCVVAYILMQGKIATRKKLAERETFLKALFNNSHDVFLLINFYSREIVDCNNTAVKVFEVKDKNALLGFKRDRFRVEQVNTENPLEIKKSIAEKGKWNGIEKYKTEKGKLFSAEVVITTLEVDKSQYYVVRITDLTERIEAKEKLEVSERRYRNLFERNLAGVFKISVDTNQLIDCNNSFARIFGFDSGKDVLGRTINSLYKESTDKYGYFDEYKNENRINHEAKIILHSGRIIWTIENTSIIEQNGVQYFEGTIMDITYLKKIQETLQESEQNYRHMFEQNPLPMWKYDRETLQFLDVNREAMKHYGYSKDEFLGMTLLDIRPKEEQKKLIDFIDSSVEVKESIKLVGKWRHQKKNGEIIDVEITRSYIDANDGNASIALIKDITQEIKYEGELVETERRFRQLANLAIEGILFTENGKVIDANKQFIKILGYESLDEILGKTIYDFVPNNYHKIARKLLSQDKSVQEVSKAVRKDGSEIFIETRGEYIYYENRKVRASVIQDVTDRKLKEKEIQNSRERFKKVVENTPDGIIIYDPEDDEVVYANNSALKLVGLESFEDLVKDSYYQFIKEDYLETTMDRFKQALKGNIQPFREIILKQSSGKEILVESKLQPIDLGGRDLVLVVLHDISYRIQFEKEQIRAEVAEELNIKLTDEIAHRKKVEETLIQNQQYTQSIIDSSLDMICATDKEGTIIEFNKSAEKAFGYKANEVMGKDASILYMHTQEKQDTFNKLLNKDGAFTGEILNRRKNGEEFISYLAASVLKNKNGDTIGLMGVSRDITKVKEAEEKIIQSEKNFRALFNQLHTGIAKVSLAGEFLQVNRRLCEILGYTEVELKGKTFNDITHEKDMGMSKEVSEQIVRGEIDEFSFDKTYVHKSGRLVEAAISTSIVKNSLSKPEYFVTIVHDVTQEKEAKRKINEQSAKLQSIFDSSSQMLIWTMDTNFRLTSYNDAVKHILHATFGININVGVDYFKLMKPFVREDLFKTFKNYFTEVLKGNPQQFEGPMHDKNGNTVWIETFINPILLDNGQIEEISAISFEITEKKLIERQIKQSLKEKEILLKEVHHRVKNNLQVISSILNLQSSYVTDENILDILSESQNRIKSMSFIHETLYQTKDFSNINFSDYILNLSNNLVHSYQVYDDLVELKHNIEDVLLNLDQAIPCGLIINELVSNALKYAFPNKAKGFIEINLSEKDGLVNMIVKDNGIGLPKNINIEEIESLGLQLVYTLTEQLDGDINYNTDKGTEFSIKFKKL